MCIRDSLLGFGGHELAAGFTIEEGNIPAFRARMNQYARKFCGGQTPVSVLDVDVPILDVYKRQEPSAAADGASGG